MLGTEYFIQLTNIRPDSSREALRYHQRRERVEALKKSGKLQTGPMIISILEAP